MIIWDWFLFIFFFGGGLEMAPWIIWLVFCETPGGSDNGTMLLVFGIGIVFIWFHEFMALVVFFVTQRYTISHDTLGAHGANLVAFVVFLLGVCWTLEASYHPWAKSIHSNVELKKKHIPDDSIVQFVTFSWQPFYRSPGTKAVKLLVGPTCKIPRSTQRSCLGIRRSPKMCQVLIP